MKTPSEDMAVAVQAASTPSRMPTAIMRRNTAGKELGVRHVFHENGTAKQIKDSFRASGLSAADASKRTRELLKTGADASTIMLVASVQRLAQQGFVPDYIDVNAKDTAATIKLVKPVAKIKVDDLASLNRAQQVEALKKLQELLGVGKGKDIDVESEVAKQ